MSVQQDFSWSALEYFFPMLVVLLALGVIMFSVDKYIGARIFPPR